MSGYIYTHTYIHMYIHIYIYVTSGINTYYIHMSVRPCGNVLAYIARKLLKLYGLQTLSADKDKGTCKTHTK